jgi:hypothetical protein
MNTQDSDEDALFRQEMNYPERGAGGFSGLRQAGAGENRASPPVQQQDVSEYLTASEAGSERGRSRHRGHPEDRPSRGREDIGRSIDQEDREPAGCREEDPDPPANASHHLGGGRPWADAAADRPPMPPRHSASAPLPPRGLPSVLLPRRGESMQQPRQDRYDSPPRGYGGAVPRRPQAGYWAGQPTPPVVGFGLEAMQGMTNAMNAIANQVIRNSGRSGRNAGWPYFGGRFRDYPAFKRKFESFQMNYHRGTPTRELFQQFREMCLPGKIAARIKSAETMENAWIRLEAWFGDKSLFIKDLMQDIRSMTPIKDGDNEHLMDYYVMLQAHIAEARNADALDMLLIPANVELMVLPLTAWEKRVWREAQGRLPAEDRSWYMDVFVNERLRYAINMVATSEKHVLPKATPLHRSQRSPSSEGRGGRYSRPGSSGRNTRVMTVTESRSADRKKVRFPPPKAWDPEAKWTQDCEMFRVCGEKHPPRKCDAFKKLSPQQRLKEIDTRELCRLCYRHLRGRDCWSKDKVPNCGIDGCEAAHHHLLHGALVKGRLMVVQGISAGKAQVFLCREDIRVEGAGKASRLHALYDWGATVTLVTHAAAEKAGLERRRQTPAAIAGLGGRCTMVDSYYMVPVVDGNDKVRVVKALGVDRITTLAATNVPEDIITRLPRTKGFVEKLARPAGDVEMLVGMDNQGWMPMHVESSRVEGDNLRLMKSMLSLRCILMGSIRMVDQGSDTQGSAAGPPQGFRRSGGKRQGPQPLNSMRVMMTMMLFMLAGLPECAAFRAYDCNNQSSQIEQYSLLAVRLHGEGTRHRTRTLRRDRTDQEGAAGAGHQVYSDADDQVSVLRIPEPFGPGAVREVSRPDRDRASGLQNGGQDGTVQAQREGLPV